MAFPVFSANTIVAHGYCHVLQINVPVHVGGLTIYPGDLIHGDANGLITIPHDIAAEVAEIEGTLIDYFKNQTSNCSDEAGDAINRCVEAVNEFAATIHKNPLPPGEMS